MKGCFFIQESKIQSILHYFYGSGRYEKVCGMLEMCADVITENNLDKNREYLKECQVIFCTWNMILTEKQLNEYFPKLELVLLAGHHPPKIVDTMVRRGIHVVTARHAMALYVAQFAVAMISLANKGALLSMGIYKNEGYQVAQQVASRKFPGTHDIKIGLLGAGVIGKEVIRLLNPYQVEILVFDPFLSEKAAEELGVRKASMEEIFAQCQTISNHLANRPETVGMIDYRHFSLMKDNAAFVNTGRGAQLIEADLLRALKEKPDRCAILDVTYPEPVAKDHPFLSMPNVFLTPHIAGYATNEVLVFADLMIEEFQNYLDGKPLRYEFTEEMLSTISRY